MGRGFAGSSWEQAELPLYVLRPWGAGRVGVLNRDRGGVLPGIRCRFGAEGTWGL